MLTVLIIIHLMIVLALIVVVLLQRSEGGLGLGGGGGTSGFMTGRGQANALTRATAILATAFFLTSMVLSILAGANRAPTSILDRAAPGAGSPAAPAAPGGGQDDFLKRLEGAGGGAPAPAPAPAPTAPGAPQAPISR